MTTSAVPVPTTRLSLGANNRYFVAVDEASESMVVPHSLSAVRPSLPFFIAIVTA